MLKDIIRGEWVTETDYEVQFYYDNTGGFAFPCDKNGKILDDLTDAAKKNYAWCLENRDKFQVFNHVHKMERSWREPDYGRCDCGETVYLQNQYMGACQCPKCGQWYSLSGEELLPPNRWGWAGDFDDVDYIEEEWA